MTDQEKQQMKAEMMKEIIAEIKNQNIKVAVNKKSILASMRNKWVKSDALHKAFGDYTDHRIWERVNYLVSRICGVKRLDLISELDFANYAADKLCQTIYDLRVEYLEKYGEGKDA